jgi:hypothetical protein
MMHRRENGDPLGKFLAKLVPLMKAHPAGRPRDIRTPVRRETE